MLDFNDAEPLRWDPAPVAKSWLDAVRGFQAAIAEAGLGSPDIMADGEIHRFDTPEDKKGAKTGWYLLYPDNIAAGAFGSWREGETRTWSARHQFEMTAEEQEAVRRRMESARRLRERARMMEADEAALEAERIWRESAPADPDHPYLVRKQVSPFMLRQEGDALIVPMIDAEGRIRGVQRIFPDGTKRYLSGVAKNGLYAWLEGDASVVYVCEGYATGASLHMATGNAVVVAFDSGNLQHVAPLVKNGFPQAQVILAADNDAFTRRQDGAPWNTGLEAASKAAKALGLTVVWPEFRDLSSRPTDFNDLHVLEGLQEVRAQAAPIESGPRISAWTADVFDGEPEPRQWLVKDMIPLGCPCLLAAAGGTGKGILLLDLALSVSSSAWRAEGVHQWLGNDVEAHGSAVLLFAEDNKDSIHERLNGLDPDGTLRRSCGERLMTVPLPNAGGPITLVASRRYGEFGVTPAYEDLKRQLRRIRDLKMVVIDPLASFVGVDINKDPQAGQYVQGVLAALAEETGAAVIVSHHMAKVGAKEGRITADNARDAIRGTTALVDGVRCAIAVWQAGDATVEDVRRLEAWRDPKDVYEAAVVKTNARADMSMRVLLRQKNGLLSTAIMEKLKESKRTLKSSRSSLRKPSGTPRTKAGRSPRQALPDCTTAAKNCPPNCA